MKKPAERKANWVNLNEVPKGMILDGLLLRYKKHNLGFIKSGWNRGFWLTQDRGGSSVTPWFPPDGKSLSDIIDDLQVEVLP